MSNKYSDVKTILSNNDFSTFPLEMNEKAGPQFDKRGKKKRIIKSNLIKC